MAAFYSIDSCPLDEYFRSIPGPPRFSPLPGCSKGYVAAWDIMPQEPFSALFLSYLSGHARQALAQRSGSPVQPMEATWFSGLIRAFRGVRRYHGHPPRTFFDEEIYLEISRGKSCVSGGWTCVGFVTRHQKNFV